MVARRVGVVRHTGRRPQPGLAAQRTADLVAEQMAQQALGHLDVDDGPAEDGPYDAEVVGRTARHLLRELADGDQGAGLSQVECGSR